MKAYDLKRLAEILKSQGLDLAEDAVILLLDSVIQWVDESAKESSTPFDDVLSLVLPKVKDFAMNYVDKIDGKEG